MDSLQAGKALTQLAMGGYDSTKVENTVFEARMKICRACPKFSPMFTQCGVCKCFLNIKARLVYDPVETDKHPTKQKQETKCPLGNW